MEESGSEGKNSRWGQVLFLVSMYRKLMRPLEECFRGRCTSHQLWAILTLEAAGPMPVGQLAEAMRVTKQQMSRMVEGLVEEGLLFRKADPSDGRRLLVGTGDSPGTVGFYQSCGFAVTGRVEGFFTQNYPAPIWDEAKGDYLRDMVYLEMGL